MTDRFRREVRFGKKILVTASTFLAAGVPIAIGVMSLPPSYSQFRAAAVAAPPAQTRPNANAPGQNAPVQRTTFEVASVKPSSPRAVGIRMRRDPGRVEYGNVALIDVLADAYSVNNRLISGPSWLADSRYDIVAKIPEGVAASQVPDMLQALLLERFQMTVHRETKMTEAYVLEVGKGGPRFDRGKGASAVDPASPHDKGLTVALPGPNSPAAGPASRPADGFHLVRNLPAPELGFQAVGVTMAELSKLLGSYVNGLVVDKTALQGRYDFTFQFDAGPEGRMPPDYSPPSLFPAVEHLGLKLGFHKVPLDCLVVLRAAKVPREN